jgi:hypothetical protein
VPQENRRARLSGPADPMTGRDLPPP